MKRRVTVCATGRCEMMVTIAPVSIAYCDDEETHVRSPQQGVGMVVQPNWGTRDLKE